MRTTYRVKIPNGLGRQEPLAKGKGVGGDCEGYQSRWEGLNFQEFFYRKAGVQATI